MSLYASTAQIKAALRIPAGDTVDDALINLAGSAASLLIEQYCGRSFDQSGTVTRLFAPWDPCVIGVDDLAGTAVTIQTSSDADGVFDVTWAPSDYQLEPLNGTSLGQPWPFTHIRAVGDYWWPTNAGEATVRITGRFGWPEVPATVTQAAVLQAARIFKRNDSVLGVAGFGDMGAIRVSRQLDPDVAMMLEAYRKHEGYA